jgi:hypothetical protein
MVIAARAIDALVALASLRRVERSVAMRLNRTGKVVLAVLVLIILYAWIDGGRQTPHLIEQPAEIAR